jgi:leucyl-tRNA synthetase
MGHVRSYTMGDVVARVAGEGFFPYCIRWAGTPSQPAENAAMERKIHPKNGPENIDAMKAQLKSMDCRSTGAAIATCDPAY